MNTTASILRSNDSGEISPLPDTSVVSIDWNPSVILPSEVRYKLGKLMTYLSHSKADVHDQKVNVRFGSEAAVSLLISNHEAWRSAFR